jgi:hypothetical protein
MEFITELEEEFASRRIVNSSKLQVQTSTNFFLFDQAKLGADFILGRSGHRVYFLPIASVFEMTGVEIEQSIDQALVDYLSIQKQPVKLVLRSNSGTYAAWLLNVVSSWLRVAGQQGVVWVPLSQLVFAESESVFAEAGA